MKKKYNGIVVPVFPETTVAASEKDQALQGCDTSSCCDFCNSSLSGKVKKAAIIGRPNTGKSHIFTNLTKQYAQSANYPFTTLKEKRANIFVKGQEYEIIDTPGMQGLFINSEEELIVRNILFNETPDIVILCADANRIKQDDVLHCVHTGLQGRP